MRTLLSALAALGLMALVACEEPPIAGPFQENFDSPLLADHWRNTGGPYEILDGRLTVKNAYNHPLWLRKPLPRDAVIEFDVETRSRAGDIKCEVYGDGETFSRQKGSYFASGYVLVLGGWNNSVSIIARMDEHGPDRKEQKDFRVKPGQVYHWKIVRKGPLLSWYVDGKLFLEFNDPSPLEGPRHQYFAFNTWQASLLFDNLRITPLAEGEGHK